MTQLFTALSLLVLSATLAIVGLARHQAQTVIIVPQDGCMPYGGVDCGTREGTP